MSAQNDTCQRCPVTPPPTHPPPTQNQPHLLHVRRIQGVVRRRNVQHGQAGGLGLRCGAQRHRPRRRLHQHVVSDVHGVSGAKLQGGQLLSGGWGWGG